MDFYLPVDLKKLFTLASVDPDHKFWADLALSSNNNYIRTNTGFTWTGRFACSRAPVQSLPTALRGAVVEDGKVVIYADYSTLHPRLLAEASGDEHLLKDIEGDVYGVVLGMLGVAKFPLDEDKLRKAAKRLMNAWLNGGYIRSTLYSGWADAGLPMPRGDFNALAKKRWPQAVKFLQDLIADATLPEAKSEDGDHLAIAQYFQGKESDMLRACIETLSEAGVNVCVPMHDGLLITAYPSEVLDVVSVLHIAMRAVDFPITIEAGPSWGDLTPWAQYNNGHPASVEEVKPQINGILEDIRTASANASVSVIIERNFELKWAAAHGYKIKMVELIDALGPRTRAGSALKSLLKISASIAADVVSADKYNNMKASAPGWASEVLASPNILTDKAGNPQPMHPPTMETIVEAYCLDKFKGKLAFDESTATYHIGDTIFKEGDHISEMVSAFASAFGWVGRYKQDVLEASKSVAYKNRHNSLQDALVQAQEDWDGVERLGSSFCETYLPGVDHDHHGGIDSIFMKKWFLGAAKRGMIPGCDMALVPILIGPQGSGKTLFVEILGEFALPFGEGGKGRMISLLAATPLGSTDAVRQFQTSWLVELGEMNAASQVKMSIAKQALSAKHDSMIPKYMSIRVDLPRKVVFIATTDKVKILRDPNGERRFHGVKIGLLNASKLTEDRAQLFGEAMYRINVLKEQPRLNTEEKRLQIAANDIYKEEVPIVDLVIEYLEANPGKYTTNALFQRIHDDTMGATSVTELRRNSNKIQNHLRMRGWANEQRRLPGAKGRTATWRLLDVVSNVNTGDVFGTPVKYVKALEEVEKAPETPSEAPKETPKAPETPPKEVKEVVEQPTTPPEPRVPPTPGPRKRPTRRTPKQGRQDVEDILSVLTK